MVGHETSFLAVVVIFGVLAPSRFLSTCMGCCFVSVLDRMGRWWPPIVSWRQSEHCIDSHCGYARRSWNFECHLGSARDSWVWFGCISDQQGTHAHDTGVPGPAESTLRAAGILRRF